MDANAQVQNVSPDKGSDSQLQDPEETSGIKFKDWEFKVDRLFEVAYRFYKRNESKAFHPTFDQRSQMNALVLQAKYGNFDEGKAPDIGVLDLIGKNRRHQWSVLKGMSKMEAMSKFICTLDAICPLFKAHAEAVKLSSIIQVEAGSWSQNGNNESESSKRKSQSNEQLEAIRTSLSKQTYNQFKSYAEKQYPDDAIQQRNLITSLQEQYYNQYISRMHPELCVHLDKESDGESIATRTNDKSNGDVVVMMEQEREDGPEKMVDCGDAEIDIAGQNNPNNFEGIAPSPSTSSISSEASMIDQTPLSGDMNAPTCFEPATLWSKSGVNEFKESLIDDKHGGSYVVKQGTLLKIQVPTYPNGKYIYWEFVTEENDIGFGLDFFPQTNLMKPLAIQICEQSDEDDDDYDEDEDEDEDGEDQADSNDIEGGANSSQKEDLLRKRAEKLARIANTISIVPTYRRDSHKEVFVGRHRYPGQGYYLLKFDNTYSVLRSKSLFFRICYFI